MAFFLRAIAWIAIHLALTAVGAVIGGLLTPKVNPHNDWGATGFMFAASGAFAGSSLAMVALLWWSERRGSD